MRLSASRQERARAARALNRVLTHGRTTEQSIGTGSTTPLETELLQGALRYYFSLEHLVRARLSRPFREKDQDLFALLLVGAYQLKHMRIPDHAAINETVAAAAQLKKPWAKGLINAVLRQIAKDADSPLPAERSFELPDWLLKRLHQDLPVQAEAVSRASIERAPMSLRVNTTKTSPECYRQRLADADIAVFQGNFPEHLILAEPIPVRDLPGYAAGEVSVQDAGAQFAARLVPAEMPEQPRILDACAAPGGKLFHLAERFPQAELVGLERSAERLAHLRQEARRLGHGHVRLLTGDATERGWLADLPVKNPRFDLILLDAPCSGSGTLRRHPDIKVLRTPADVTASAALQLALLENLWPLLADDGCLLYCTCSLLAEENDQVIETFVQQAADEPANATSVPTPRFSDLDLPVGQSTRFGWQLLPLPAGDARPNRSVDGFYFARMTRQEKAR